MVGGNAFHHFPAPGDIVTGEQLEAFVFVHIDSNAQIPINPIKRKQIPITHSVVPLNLFG